MCGGGVNVIDVIVIGGGHAGCEAALSAARMGLKTMMFAINLDSIAMMACNPNIGGTSKGHLVKEIDALGGEMAKNTDRSYIQSRMLNTGKGPAVHSLRVQADKWKYAKEMKKTLENQENLQIRQSEIVKVIVEEGVLKGVQSESGAIYHAKACVLTAGTYLKARCLYGETIVESGPSGMKASTLLSDSLRELGIHMLRFKTGTPARIDKRSVDFSKMVEQLGDAEVVPFSFENTQEEIAREQISCWLTYTNEDTHAIIRENLHRSPMYSGVIEGVGTRYCPSIEDKIVRFADKDKHQVFIEPEGEDTNEMYVQGMSTSLPEDVQIQMYRSIEGLEHCEIMRSAYAIEYDCIDATQLKLSLEFKAIKGFFSAGQINGSSGYEEAAAQGLLAGINAARYAKEQDAFILDRSEAYLGVLVDDLVTKGTKEPYRMMTSRAEYRLVLRQDNADLRLTEKAYEIGLVKEERYRKFLEKREKIEKEVERVNRCIIAPTEKVNALLRREHTATIITGTKLAELIKRPELHYHLLAEIDEGREPLPKDVMEQVNVIIKYEGYIKRQLMQIEQFKKIESKTLPQGINYHAIHGLRLEARQKLSLLLPENIGQASRITGVSPADISVLLIYLQAR